MRSFLCRIASAAFLSATGIALISSTASAQWVQNSNPSKPRQETVDMDRRHVIFANPFGILYGMYTAEFETKINQSLTLAISGTLWEKLKEDEIRSNSVNAAIRFYPLEKTLRGFSVSPMLGIVKFKEKPDPCVSTPTTSCDDKNTTNATFGFQLDYGWLMGPSQRFAVGTGLGVKRVLGDTGGKTDFLPAMRFHVGYAF